MTKNSQPSFYDAIVFGHAKWVVLVVALIVAFLSQYATNFRLDASSDSLVLENDKSLKYFREVVSKYNTGDLLVLTYAPEQDLFSDAVLEDISLLRQRLLEVDNIKSIISILDVPLVQSPPVTLGEFSNSQQTLLNPKTDRALARKELRDSQLYRDLLVSNDYSTTAIVIALHADTEVGNLLERRNELRQLKRQSELTPDQYAELTSVTLEHQAKHAVFQESQNKLIDDVRAIVAMHKDKATVFLGGLPMIVSDSIRFIESDVVVFGIAALLVIVFILIVAFRQVGWVLMPLLSCFVTGYIMVCLLGLLNWPISVVSSNFLSLLLIITLSLNIHLIVRYNELSRFEPTRDHLGILRDMIQSKFVPCVYTALTTMVAFASLIVSGIRPVIDFGWIMCLGIFVALVTTFTVFPALATFIKPQAQEDSRDPVSGNILSSALSLHGKGGIVGFFFITISLIAAYGVANLSVENRFIDYFKSDTEIYQGMYEIDSKLGGTTPLDIIIDAPVRSLDLALPQATNAAPEPQANGQAEVSASDVDDDFAAFEEDFDQDFEEDFDEDFDDFEDDFDDEFQDDFADDFSDQASTVNSKKETLVSGYWFNVDGLQKIREIQDSLEALPATGKVLSLATSMSVFDNLKDAEPMDNIDLGFMYNVLSDENKNTLFTPYISPDGNQLHINIRVFESQKGLDRGQLITDIRQLLVEQHGIADEQVNISGLLVMYNNMLNSLFNSQILTLGTVFLVILLMFIVLFRSIKLAFITIVPNIFSAAVVLGVMGIFAIPLDLMTITIAAISVGIAVDNSIHLVARFKDERRDGGDYEHSVATSTSNVGQAMFYTTLVITSGFLIMVFSNFVPTMFFGMLTALAMVTALITNLVMLPMLILKFRPLG